MRGKAASALLWSVALLAAPAIGAENSREEHTPATSDPIQDARKGYDAIKSSRTTFESRIELPKLSAPSLQIPTDEAGSALRAAEAEQREREQQARPGTNWLVDGAMPRRGEKSANGRPEFSRGDETAGSNGKTKAAADGRSSTDRDRDADSNRRQAAADNPLNRYLATWMTPKDLELLQTKSDDDLLGKARLPSSIETDPRGTQSEHFKSVDPARQLSLGREKSVNPYLETATAASPAPTRPDAPVTLRAPSGVNLAPPPSLARKIEAPDPKPERVPPAVFKPSTDAKYFPQLKRF